MLGILLGISENRKKFLSGQPTRHKSAEGGRGCLFRMRVWCRAWCHSVDIGSVLQCDCGDVAMFLAFCLDIPIILCTFAAF